MIVTACALTVVIFFAVELLASYLRETFPVATPQRVFTAPALGRERNRRST